MQILIVFLVVFLNIKIFQNLSLNTTSLLCDCSLHWFAEWLHVQPFKVHAVCSYPDWLRGLPLLDVPPNNFTCGKGVYFLYMCD